MIKIIFTLFICFLGITAFSQKTKKEQIHFKDVNCEYDTLTWVYNNSDVKVNDDEKKEVVITDGNKKILYIQYFTSKCECSDCSEYNHIAITIDSLKKGEVYYLKAEEVKWVYGNSWTKPKFITTYLGTITMIDEKHYEIRISELLGSTVIRTISLTAKMEG